MTTTQNRPAAPDLGWRGNLRFLWTQLTSMRTALILLFALAVAAIPEARRQVISSHDAFGYLADEYGIAFIAPQGVSTDSEPSAQDLAKIINQVKTAKIPAVFLENISDPRLMRRIAADTGAKIGGTLYSDSLTAENGDAPTYIDMVRHNIKALTSALN